MPFKSAAALCLGLTLSGLMAVPASAQTRQRVTADGTTYTVTGEDGRRRTTVIIQKRSFLDGGTEVLPGSKPTTTNAMPFGYSPLNVVEGTIGSGMRFPLPGPYDLAGKNNPFW